MFVIAKIAKKKFAKCPLINKFLNKLSQSHGERYRFLYANLNIFLLDKIL